MMPNLLVYGGDDRIDCLTKKVSHDTNLSIGNLDVKNEILNLTGDNLYLLMNVNDYESIISNSSINSSFAKILLTGAPGDVLFNTFVNYPIEFDIPISTLSQLDIKFIYTLKIFKLA